MKWAWVVCAVFFLPVPAMADKPLVAMVIENWRVWTFAEKGEDAAVLAVTPKEGDLHNVWGTVRLYLKPEAQINQIHKTRCGVVMGREKMTDISKHLIEGSHGQELWFPYIPENTVAEFALYEETLPAELLAVPFDVTSNEGEAAFTWIRGFPFTQQWISSFEGYQEVEISDICRLHG